MVSVWGGERPLSPPPSGTVNILTSTRVRGRDAVDPVHPRVPVDPISVGAEMALATPALGYRVCASAVEAVAHREALPEAGACHPDVASGAADKGSPLFAVAHPSEGELSCGSSPPAPLRNCGRAYVPTTPTGCLSQTGESHHGEDLRGGAAGNILPAAAAGPGVRNATGISHPHTPACGLGATNSPTGAVSNQHGSILPALYCSPLEVLAPQELSLSEQILHREAQVRSCGYATLRPALSYEQVQPDSGQGLVDTEVLATATLTSPTLPETTVPVRMPIPDRGSEGLHGTFHASSPHLYDAELGTILVPAGDGGAVGMPASAHPTQGDLQPQYPQQSPCGYAHKDGVVRSTALTTIGDLIAFLRGDSCCWYGWYRYRY